MKTLKNDQKPCSLLGADQVFVNKILARNSSISCSSSSSKHSSRVPFKWEIQAGKPKHPQTETAHSSSTSHSPPYLGDEEFSKPRASSARKRVFFWKKYSIKSLRAAKDDANSGAEVLQNPNFNNSVDASLTPSSSSVSDSTSSSAISSKVNSTRRPLKLKSLAKGIIKYVSGR